MKPIRVDKVRLDVPRRASNASCPPPIVFISKLLWCCGAYGVVTLLFLCWGGLCLLVCNVPGGNEKTRKIDCATQNVFLKIVPVSLFFFFVSMSPSNT